MDKDKLEELLEARKLADQEIEKMRTAVTILFTDIQGSTAYFERKGDVRYATANGEWVVSYAQGFPVGRFEASKGK